MANEVAKKVAGIANIADDMEDDDLQILLVKEAYLFITCYLMVLWVQGTNKFKLQP